MGATRSGLTSKQLHFARCVASGMSQADAYREAYDVGENTKASTCHEKASRLMAEAKIRARVEALVQVREKAILRSAVADREAVLAKLRDWLDSATKDDLAKIRAAELLGKSVGLFKDVVETAPARTVAELEAELEERLKLMTSQPEESGQPDDPGNPEPGTVH